MEISLCSLFTLFTHVLDCFIPNINPVSSFFVALLSCFYHLASLLFPPLVFSFMLIFILSFLSFPLSCFSHASPLPSFLPSFSPDDLIPCLSFACLLTNPQLKVSLTVCKHSDVKVWLLLSTTERDTGSRARIEHSDCFMVVIHEDATLVNQSLFI